MSVCLWLSFCHIHRTVCCLCSRWRQALLLLPVSAPHDWLPFMKGGQTGGSLEEKCLLWRWRTHFTLGAFHQLSAALSMLRNWTSVSFGPDEKDHLCWFLILKIDVLLLQVQTLKFVNVSYLSWGVEPLEYNSGESSMWQLLSEGSVYSQCKTGIIAGLLQCQLLYQTGFFTSSGKTGCCCSSRTSTWGHVQSQELRLLKYWISVFNSI